MPNVFRRKRDLGSGRCQRFEAEQVRNQNDKDPHSGVTTAEERESGWRRRRERVKNRKKESGRERERKWNERKEEIRKKNR